MENVIHVIQKIIVQHVIQQEINVMSVKQDSIQLDQNVCHVNLKDVQMIVIQKQEVVIHAKKDISL